MTNRRSLTRIPLFLFCLLLFSGTVLFARESADNGGSPRTGAEPFGLTCEYQANPLGIDIARPVLGWKLSSGERNQYQTAYELIAALSEKDLEQGENLVWKSGKIVSGQSFNIPYGGKPLRPFTRYHWKVKVYDRDGKASGWSPAAHWETAMLSPSDWKALWIGDGSAAPRNEKDFYKDDPAPLFRKVFTAKKDLVRARLYITGLGYYEASINGNPVGDRRLDPGWTSYGKQILYSVFDVTSLVRSGENAVGVTLGNGFYNPLPMRIFRKLRDYLYIGRPCFIAQIKLSFADGSEEWIVTDESWKTTAGPILRNNVYLGEHYDARRELAGWDKAGFDDRNWNASVKIAPPSGALTAQMQPPIRVTKVLKPVKMTEPRPGEFVFDMGQNLAGVARLKVGGARGTHIKIRYGEDIYTDGRLNVMTSVAGQVKSGNGGPGAPRIAWQEDSYILKGEGEEIWSPRFTFHGFRYVEITGFPGRPGLDNVEALRINADLPQAGRFDCSSPLLQKLNTVLDYTFKSNVFSVQSDCPAREKFGYGGDIVATARTFCWFYDMSNFYRKALRDFANDQRPLGGFPETAPYNGIADSGLGDGSGPIGWQLAFAFLQKQLYEYYGDIRVIQSYYPALRKQVEFLRTKAQNHIINRCINDHESLEPRVPALFATAHYYYHAALLAEFAGLTKQADDEKIYTALAGDIKNAFIKRFVKTGTGVVGNQTQAAQATALFYNLLPDGDREAAFNVLLKAIEKRNGHIASGIFGVPLVLDALSRHLRNDIAYEMVAKKDFPGWGHMLRSGATTLWETWKYSDNVYSQNHPMFGSVGEWMYQSVLGINAGTPAFKRIILRPQPAGDLTFASGSYESLWGTIESSWKTENNRFSYNIAIPSGTTAEVWLPKGDVTESGKPIAAIKEIRFLRNEKDRMVFEVQSGKYAFLVNARTTSAAEAVFPLPDAPVELRCEYGNEPLGIDTETPRFGWKLRDNSVRGQKQTAYHILVASGEALLSPEKADVWNSGKFGAPQSVLIPFTGKKLVSNRKYFWTVRVFDKDGRPSAWSKPAAFVTGLLSDEAWSGAQWIKHPTAPVTKHIWFRKSFALGDAVRSAYINVASIGYHELYINGQKADDRLLAPALTNLHKRALVITYDVSKLLRKGENVIAVWQGSGWASADYFKRVMCFKAKMNVRAKDGEEFAVVTGAGWKCAVSNSENLHRVTGWNNNGGERIDARAYIADWNKTGFDDSAWENSAAVDCRVKLTSHALMEPTRIVETYKPVAITGDGTYRIEFAKNFTGWCKIDMTGLAARDTVTIMTADDEKTVCDFNQKNVYIANGAEKETYCNRFNYTGGRFFTVKGLKKKPAPEDVTGYALATDLNRTGYFTSSNELYNKIYELDLWTYRATTLEGFTMDCPHRERCGYGETTITSAWGTGFPNYETGAFYHRILLDLLDAQEENGFVHNTAPQSPSQHYGGPMFSCAGLNVAVEHYLNFGDARILELIYPSAKKWLEFLNANTVDGLLVSCDKHWGKFLGEWAAPKGRLERGGSPQAKYFNNCVYAMNLADFVGIAKKLGRAGDAALYSQRLDSLKRRIHEKFYNEKTGAYSDGNQAQQAFALTTGIAPEHLKPAVAARLRRELHETHPYLDVGSAGLPVLLSYFVNHPEDGGTAAKILNKTDYPGYGYFVKRGETTFPEYWEVDVPSRIHTCYSGIAAWFVKGLCGIQPDAAKPGYQSFLIRPVIVPEADFAEAAVESPYGKIVSRWERAGDKIIFSATVPPNASATLYIPAAQPEQITENGISADKIEGVILKGAENGYVVADVVSEKYRFVISPAKP